MAGGGGIAPDWIEHSRLWLVLDRTAAAPRTLPEITQLAIAGGVDAVLCRIKDAPGAEVEALARPVRAVCREAAVPFVMSHFPELAAELSADAVQIGAADPNLPAIRRVVGEQMPVGCSTHGIEEARMCFAAGAAYVFLGPVYPTPAKLKYGAPLGLEIVAEAAGLPGPVVFIGGITAANVDPLVAAGARRVAAIAALQRVTDPLVAARELRGRLGGG